MASLSRTFVATSVSNIVGRGAFLLSGFIGTILIARSVPPGDYGTYALLIVLNSYAVVACDLGLSSGVLRYAAAADRDDPGAEMRLLRYAAFRQLSVALAVGIIAFLATPKLETAFGTSFGVGLVLAVALALATVLRFDLQNLRISAGRGAAIVGANLCYAVIWLGGLIGLRTTGLTVTRVLLLQTAASTAVALWLLIAARPWERARPVTTQSPPDGLMSYSSAFVARGLVTLIVQKQSEVFFLGHYGPMSSVGFYDVGYNLSFFALMSVHQALYPVAIASLTRAASESMERLHAAIKVYYKVTFVHVIPIAVIGLLFGDRIVPIVYGTGMAPAGPIARALFGVTPLLFLTAGVAVGMLAIGKPWAGIHLSVLTAVINLGLDFLLIPRFGIPGAIAAVATTALVSGILFLRYYRTYLGPDLIPWQYLGRCLLASTPLLALLPFRSSLDSIASLAAFAPAAGLLVLLGMRLSGVVGQQESTLLRATGFATARRLADLLSSRS